MEQYTKAMTECENAERIFNEFADHNICEGSHNTPAYERTRRDFKKYLDTERRRAKRWAENRGAFD